MKAEIKKASDSDYLKVIDINTLEDLELIYIEYGSERLIIDFKPNKIKITIYDSNIE